MVAAQDVASCGHLGDSSFAPVAFGSVTELRSHNNQVVVAVTVGAGAGAVQLADYCLGPL